MVELIGYIATVFILASFATSDLKRLRVLNSIGAILWIVYGVIQGAQSIMVANIIILGLQIYKCNKENNEKR